MTPETPEPITVYQTRTLQVDRYVAPPERMTRPVEVVELSPDFDLPELGAGFKACTVRTQQCNGQLAEIEGLAGDTVNPGKESVDGAADTTERGQER